MFSIFLLILFIIKVKILLYKIQIQPLLGNNSFTFLNNHTTTMKQNTENNNYTKEEWKINPYHSDIIGTGDATAKQWQSIAIMDMNNAKQNKANAELICTAVNGYEATQNRIQELERVNADLLEALRDCLSEQSTPIKLMDRHQHLLESAIQSATK